MEKFFYDFGVVGDVWEWFFDEIIVGFEFDMEGEIFNIEVMLNFFIDLDCSKCEVVVCEVVCVFGGNIKFFVCVYNIQVKEKEVMDCWCNMLMV